MTPIKKDYQQEIMNDIQEIRDEFPGLVDIDIQSTEKHLYVKLSVRDKFQGVKSIEKNIKKPLTKKEFNHFKGAKGQLRLDLLKKRVEKISD